MSEVKINYYEIERDTPVLDYDPTHHVAPGKVDSGGTKWMIKKGQYVKSFGNTDQAKTQTGKETVLILVNGMAVRMSDVKLYLDHVDDCGCDGNPIALPTDVAKALQKDNDVKIISNESSFSVQQVKSKIDKNAIIGLIIGLLLVGGIVWYRTRNWKRSMFAAIGGGVIGFIIGYFIGKRGENRVATVNNLIDTDAPTTASIPSQPTGTSPERDADKQEYLQVDNVYDFALKTPLYAMTLANGAFHRAVDARGNRLPLKNKGLWSGKLIQVESPEFFILDPAQNKIARVRSNKPLPFIDLGNDLFIPLSATDPGAVITADEFNQFTSGEKMLDDEIYIKGRYAGKKSYNLIYMPTYEAQIRTIVGGT